MAVEVRTWRGGASASALGEEHAVEVERLEQEVVVGGTAAVRVVGLSAGRSRNRERRGTRSGCSMKRSCLFISLGNNQTQT
jgi:hypothetical protein